jgi:hypothetical protein
LGTRLVGTFYCLWIELDGKVCARKKFVPRPLDSSCDKDAPMVGRRVSTGAYQALKSKGRVRRREKNDVRPEQGSFTSRARPSFRSLPNDRFVDLCIGNLPCAIGRRKGAETQWAGKNDQAILRQSYPRPWARRRWQRGRKIDCKWARGEEAVTRRAKQRPKQGCETVRSFRLWRCLVGMW